MKIVYKIYPKFLVKNIIIFESSPDMTGNAYELYKVLLSKKYNLKYKFVWFVSDKKKFSNIKEKNVVFVTTSSRKHIINYLKKIYYNLSAKIIIDSNSYIHKFNKYQTRIHLFHGISYKNVPEYTNNCGDADYFITYGKYFHPILEKQLNNPADRFIDLGMARNDILVKKTKKNINKLFGIPKGAKIILWLPTYRNHKNNQSMDRIDNNIMIINNEKEIIELNKQLIKNNVYILLKLHPAEDTSTLNKIKTSNIIMIDDNLLTKNNINLYELLSKTDSLLTDYSSVYFDYLLTDNMIGLTFNDLDYYTKTKGFICDNYDDVVYGEKIYAFDDFINYIKNVSTQKYDKRKYKKFKKMYHTYDDGNSTKRLYDFIKKFL